MYFKPSRKSLNFGFSNSFNFACLCKNWPLKAHGDQCDHPSLLVWWPSWLCQRKTTIYHTMVGHCQYFDNTSRSEVKKWQSKCSWNGKGTVIYPKYYKHLVAMHAKALCLFSTVFSYICEFELGWLFSMKSWDIDLQILTPLHIYVTNTTKTSVRW